MAAARRVGAVMAGAAVWAVLWVGGSMVAQAAAPDLLPVGQRIDHVGALLGYIAYSAGLSVLAGWTTGRVAGSAASRAVMWLAGLQLVLGVGFEVTAWQLTPAWYHVVFLLLIVPATLYGGRLAARAPSHRSPVPAA